MAYKGLARPSLLESYEIERLPVVAEMLNLTKELHKHTAAARIKFVDDAAQDTSKDPMFRPKSLSQIWVNYRWSAVVLDERFPTGAGEKHINPFGVEGDVLQAGDRAPDAPMLKECGPDASQLAHTTNISLFKLFSPTLHTLLVFPQSDSVPTDLELLSLYRSRGVLYIWSILGAEASYIDVGADKTFFDMFGHAAKAYGIGRDSSVGDVSLQYFLIRPDGMLGVCCENISIVLDYFHCILNV